MICFVDANDGDDNGGGCRSFYLWLKVPLFVPLSTAAADDDDDDDQ